MPFVASDDSPQTTFPPAPPVAPSTEATLGAAFRQGNSVVSGLSAIANSGTFEPQPGYSARDEIKDRPEYWEHAFQFAASRSPGETAALKSRIDRENEDKRVMAASGGMGVVASLAAGATDPTMLLPGRVAIGIAKDGTSIIRGAMEVGGAMAVQSTAQELALHGSQETRTAGESVLNVGSATLLGALLGSAAGSLSHTEFAGLTAALDRDRARMDEHANGPQPAGAAATDTREVRPVSAFGMEKAAADAKTRLMNNPLTAARRTNADLGEQVLLTEENLKGEPTVLGGGPSVETELRVNKFSNQVGIMKMMDEQWKDLRFAGDKAPWFARFRDTMGWLGRPAELPTYEEFDRMVGEAMTKEGGRHDIPQVQAAAQDIMARRAPWVDRAEKSLEGFQRLEPKEGEAQFPHDWDRQKIVAQRPEFVNFLTGIFDGTQRVKQGIQTRVRAYSNALEAHNGSIKKLTGQLERKKASLEEDEALRDEVSRINKFAFQRATSLREGEFRNEGGVRVAEPGKNIEKARGGAVFETKVRERGNELADRASAHLAEVEVLEDRLNREHATAAEVRAKIEDEIGKWEGKSTQEAKGALKDRAKYEAERAAKAAEKGGAAPTKRLASADDAVDSAVKRILTSNQDLEVQELRDRAHQTADHILGGPAGRIYGEGSASRGEIPGGAGDNLRGSEARRTINVSNAEAWPWINQSAEKVANRWFDTLMPDVLISERFGDVDMKEPIQKIRDEHAARSDALPPGRKGREALDKAKNQAEEDIVHMRDSMRGVLNIPATETDRRIMKIGGIARNFNVLTSMGVSAVASLGDAAGMQMRFGMLNTFRDAFMPYFQSLVSGGEFNREALRQAKALGIAVDWELAARHHALSGVMEEYHPSSRFERTLQAGADKMQLMNGLATWTDRVKTMTTFVAAAEMKRAMEAMAKGTATKKQMMVLGENNITPPLAEKILAQYEQHAPDGLLPNMGEWTNQEAKRAFNGALAREANIGVVTPGIGDKPNWMADPVLGILGQFKSYTAAAHTRILIANLQRRDADVLSGLVGAMGLGMLSYKINSLTGGQPTSDKPGDWIKEGMSRSNMLGWFEEGNAFASKMTRGQLDAYRLTGSDHMLSKYAGRSVMDQIMGPTAGKIERLATVTGSAASMDWKASDTHALRQLFFYQNLVYVRGLLNQVEQGANTAFGVPAQKASTPH